MRVVIRLSTAWWETEALWRLIGLILAGLILGASFRVFVSIATHVPGPEGLLFWLWHGSW